MAEFGHAAAFHTQTSPMNHFVLAQINSTIALDFPLKISMIAFNDKPLSARQLTQSVLQITAMLGMYQAELARILHLQCADIGQLANAKTVLEPGSVSHQQAMLFVRFYRLLSEYCNGNEVAMINWLRRDHPKFDKTPLLAMVDDLKIKEVIQLFE